MNYAILLLAGRGVRFGTTKQFIHLEGKPLFYYPLKVLEEDENIDGIVLVSLKDHFAEIELLTKDFNFNKVIALVEGGDSRQESVFNGLKSLANIAREDDVILIHDSARPLLYKEIIDESIITAHKFGAVTAVIKSSDTLITSEDGVDINNYVDREKIYSVLTPQTFKFGLIYQAHLKERTNFSYTDDTQLVINAGISVRIITGRKSLLKVTTREDLKLLSFLLLGDNQ